MLKKSQMQMFAVLYYVWLPDFLKILVLCLFLRKKEQDQCNFLDDILRTQKALTLHPK